LGHKFIWRAAKLWTSCITDSKYGGKLRLAVFSFANSTADIATTHPTDYACLRSISANADADATTTTTTTTTTVSVSGGRRSLSRSAMESASTAAAAAATWIYWWLWYSSTATTERWFRKILNF
jgi:hypothetical protein